MASKEVPAFLALLMITMTILFPAAIHGCEPSCSNPAPPPPPAVPTPSHGTCPIGTADLSVCVDLLGSLLNIRLNVASSQQCCPLLQRLASADAALCVCEVITILKVAVPVNVNVLLNKCNMPCPPGFTCPL